MVVGYHRASPRLLPRFIPERFGLEVVVAPTYPQKYLAAHERCGSWTPRWRELTALTMADERARLAYDRVAAAGTDGAASRSGSPADHGEPRAGRPSPRVLGGGRGGTLGASAQSSTELPVGKASRASPVTRLSTPKAQAPPCAIRGGAGAVSH
jgi:hypothetical protein